MEFALMPNLSSIQHLEELKLVPKKDVVSVVAKTRPQK